jgi:chromosome segregation ATPase
LPAQPALQTGGETDAVIIATQKLQEAEREIDNMRRQLTQAEWDLNLWRQQAATGFSERDRAFQQVKDVTQQLRQNFLELSSAQDHVQTLQRDSLTEQNRLKQLLKLQNACQYQPTRPAN